MGDADYVWAGIGGLIGLALWFWTGRLGERRAAEDMERWRQALATPEGDKS